MNDRKFDRRHMAISILALATSLLCARGATSNAKAAFAFEQTGDPMLIVRGMKRYKQTQYSQRIATTGGRDNIQVYHKSRDDVWTNAPTAYNPNRFHPYAVPAGLDDAKDWTSETYYSLPEGTKIKAWTSRAPRRSAGSASLPVRNRM